MTAELIYVSNMSLDGLSPAREDGANMHAVEWTVKSLDDAIEEKIIVLAKKAAGKQNREGRTD